MVNIQRLEANMVAFIDEDLVPKMPKLEGIAFSALAPMVIRSKLPKVLSLVNGTDLVTGENIDVDKLYQAFKSKAQGKWPVEVVGFRFYEEDLDKLYHYLQR